jgi:hypothetical protein
MGLSWRWHFHSRTRETGLAAENDSSRKNWELMKKLYDEIIQLDDGTKRDVVNAVLIFIIETYEAPHLLVKYKLLATSVTPTSIANRA